MAQGNLPIGFIMSIAQNQEAMKNFSNLDDTNRNKITNYIQASATGEDALERINISINNLEKNDLNFLN